MERGGVSAAEIGDRAGESRVSGVAEAFGRQGRLDLQGDKPSTSEQLLEPIVQRLLALPPESKAPALPR